MVVPMSPAAFRQRGLVVIAHLRRADLRPAECAASAGCADDPPRDPHQESAATRAVFSADEIIRLDAPAPSAGIARLSRIEPRLVGRRFADARGEGREGVQRIAELVERQRLHMKLDVGALATCRIELVNAPSCDGDMVSGPRRRQSIVDAHPARASISDS